MAHVRVNKGSCNAHIPGTLEDHPYPWLSKKPAEVNALWKCCGISRHTTPSMEATSMSCAASSRGINGYKGYLSTFCRKAVSFPTRIWKHRAPSTGLSFKLHLSVLRVLPWTALQGEMLLVSQRKPEALTNWHRFESFLLWDECGKNAVGSSSAAVIFRPHLPGRAALAPLCQGQHLTLQNVHSNMTKSMIPRQ